MTQDYDENGIPTDHNHAWNRPEPTIESQRQKAIERRLSILKTAFDDGNLAGLDEAIGICYAQSIPLPLWCLAPLRESNRRDMRGESVGQRGQSKWITRYLNDQKDYSRYEAVLEARENGVQWTDVYAEVSKLLYGHPAQDHAVEKAYKRVKKAMKENPGRYLVIKFGLG